MPYSPREQVSQGGIRDSPLHDLYYFKERYRDFICDIFGIEKTMT